MNEEFVQAIKELQIAENHFNFAEPDFFDSANFALTAAKYKVSAIYESLKGKV